MINRFERKNIQYASKEGCKEKIIDKPLNLIWLDLSGVMAGCLFSNKI